MNDTNLGESGTRRQRPWLALVVLGGALIIWAVLLAVGAYLEVGADQPERDLRKALIILAVMGAFLTFWSVALWRRGKRASRRRDPPPR